MATPAKIRGEVDSLLRLLINNDIALYVSQVVMERQAPRIRITWPSRSQNWRLGFGKPFGSIDEIFSMVEKWGVFGNFV